MSDNIMQCDKENTCTEDMSSPSKCMAKLTLSADGIAKAVAFDVGMDDAPPRSPKPTLCTRQTVMFDSPDRANPEEKMAAAAQRRAALVDVIQANAIRTQQKIVEVQERKQNIDDAVKEQAAEKIASHADVLCRLEKEREVEREKLVQDESERQATVHAAKMEQIEKYKAQLLSHKFELINADTLKDKSLTELCDMLVNEEKALLAAESDVKANQERTMDSQSLLADDVAQTKAIMQLANANVVLLKKAITLKKEAMHEQPITINATEADKKKSCIIC